MPRRQNRQGDGLDWPKCSDRATDAPASHIPTTAARRRGARSSARICIAALPEGDDLSELHELLRTAGVAVVGEAVQHRERPHPNTYLGPGKLEEVSSRAQAGRRQRGRLRRRAVPAPGAQPRAGARRAGRRPHGDHPRHLRRARELGSEGKLQVELAQLEYNLARMRGLWTHLERLGGGIGTRGPGESQIETDRRLARDRISALKRRLEHVQSSRAVMRAERERAHVPLVALAGYTNAGKSTLLNRMTGAEVGVRDRLFHTLDPTTRSLRIDGRPYLLTDTVGFIRKLPHQLVEAFGATLEETQARRPDPARRGRLRGRGRDARDAARRRRRARRDRRRRAAAAAGAQQGRRARRRAPRWTSACAIPTPCSSARSPARASTSSASASSRSSSARCADVELLLPYSEGARLAELHEVAGDRSSARTPPRACACARGCRDTIAERYLRVLRQRRARGLEPARQAPRPARGAADPRPPRRRRPGPPRARRLRARPRRARCRSAPASRSRCRRAPPASCCRAAAWPPATASRSSTRPA